MRQEFRTSELDIDATGATNVTAALQGLIDAAAAAHGVAVIEAGTYLTAPLFVGSDMELRLEEGAVLLGTQDESLLPVVPTRVAGLEMDWYPGVLNVNGQHDVVIRGAGAIDGQGEAWWAKFWGPDTKGGMAADYEARGLRWAVDYDCMRPRNLVVCDSRSVELRDITSRRSGFWNIHVCYSDHVHVDGVHVEACGWNSPSTDGIDIDSSSDVLVERCEVDCHDDNICIKAGRDADGLRVARPCHHVTVRDCVLHGGSGVTLGSEVSGGISDITIERLQFRGTDCGLRVKSAWPRKGYVRDIVARDLDMKDVARPISMRLNWFPEYSLCKLPEGYDGPVPDTWARMVDASFADLPNTKVERIEVEGLSSRLSPEFSRRSVAFLMEGFADSPISGVTLSDAKIEANEYGSIENVTGLRFENVEVSLRQLAAGDVGLPSA